MSKLEVIKQCLELAPVPCLGAAFGLFKSIWEVVQLVGSYKNQLKELARSIALLLSTLNNQYHHKEPTESSTWDALSDLGSLLRDILDLVTKQKSYGFFKFLFVKDDMQLTIDSYHRRITTAIRNFQVSALLDIQALQQQNHLARKHDHEQVLIKLQDMETNQNLLIRELQGQRKDPMLTMAALQKRLDNRQGVEAELKFFSRSLEYMQQSTQSKLDYNEDWMITSLEVEFGRVISKGGLHSGVIRQGKWKGMDVALKVLINNERVTPHEADLRNEINTWSKLRHTNILQFLGASVFDDEPFIVMPLIKQGNVRDYLTKNPKCNRVKIIHEISLGIVYLHSKHVIHGDLKAANVLIDHGERPLLCDFGLSRIKENIDSRSSNQAASSAQGSLNWMAPERLEGRKLRTPCDIYSFAMTIYEIYTDSTPFGGVQPSDFREVVAVQHRRPDRPDYEEAPQLTDDGWKLMVRCWAPEPLDRPQAEAVCAELDLMKTAADTSTNGTGRYNPRTYSEMSPASGYGPSERPSRRQTTEVPSASSNQRPPPTRKQTPHLYPGNMNHENTSNPSHGPVMQPIMEEGLHAEPLEMDSPFIHPDFHPHNRRNTANHGRHPSHGESQLYVAPTSQSHIPQYPSPPHSAPSYSPPSSYNLPSSYSPPHQMRTAYSDSPSYNTHLPLDPTPPTYPPRNHTLGSTANTVGGYPSYYTGPYGQGFPQAPQLGSRSQTLPVPVIYNSDRARSPDPVFPQPFHHG